jgi:hypothetical protein
MDTFFLRFDALDLSLPFSVPRYFFYRLRRVPPATMERAILYRLQTALAQAQQEHGFRVKHGVCG